MNYNLDEVLYLYFYLAFAASKRRVDKVTANLSLENLYKNREKIDLKSLKLKPKQIDYYNNFIKKSYEILLSWMKKKDVKFLTKISENYPKLFQRFSNPPGVVFFRGEFPSVKDEFSVSVVGTRKYSKYAEIAIDKIVPGLVKSGVTIISGLAQGVDSLSHWSAVKNGGRTIGVLGSGVDNRSIFPQENVRLAREIIKNGGAIISEYPPNYPSFVQNFPARNRLVAGMSKATLVIEAPKKSGALITANFAKKYGKKVFVVPGEITKNSFVGSNNLIKFGAKLTTTAEDILSEFGVESVKNTQESREYFPESENEKVIIQSLKSGDLQIDDLARSSKINLSILNTEITMMELKGIVKNIGGGVYKLIE